MKKEKLKIEFKEISQLNFLDAHYSDNCSGSRSDCCTRVCTRANESDAISEWDNYLEVEAGVIQY
ncbi:TPA: hypothetical protein R1670_001080 [Campylobacter coli]|nr:hypothetical protein [Campylobacter coli]HEF1919709.1 hypothetical protein [Campylobacter coli]